MGLFGSALDFGYHAVQSTEVSNSATKWHRISWIKTLRFENCCYWLIFTISQQWWVRKCWGQLLRQLKICTKRFAAKKFASTGGHIQTFDVLSRREFNLKAKIFSFHQNNQNNAMENIFRWIRWHAGVWNLFLGPGVQSSEENRNTPKLSCDASSRELPSPPTFCRPHKNRQQTQNILKKGHRTFIGEAHAWFVLWYLSASVNFVLLISSAKRCS